MKRLKQIARILVVAPLILIGVFLLYEALGLCVNHLAAGRQTKRLVANLRIDAPDIEVIDVRSETGNTSGTGNHVECLSSVVFSTETPKGDLEARIAARYPEGEGTYRLSQTEDGLYRLELIASAPFADNIEGH